MKELSKPATSSSSSAGRNVVPRVDFAAELQKLSHLQSMQSEVFRNFVLAQFKRFDPATGEKIYT